MNYEIESALSKKADDWKVNNLEQEISGLRNTVRQQEERIQQRDNSIQQGQRSLAALVDLLLEKEGVSEEEQYQLHNIKNNQY